MEDRNINVEKMRTEKMSIKLSDYAFDIPKELIAQKPLERRDNSRLLVLKKDSGAIEHSSFKNIADYFNEGDCVVLNRTKVIPARVFGKKETGGRVEILFLEPKAQVTAGKYHAMLRPGLPAGKKIYFEEGITVTVADSAPGRESVVELEGTTFEDLLEKFGVMPLPPYIKREKDNTLKDFDLERYQTVYAKEKGSIAAPTAGLHFTDELLEKLKRKGVKAAEIVLHVGRGTFKMIDSEDISGHKMLPEYFEISDEAARTINEAKSSGKRIFACGTTSVRALESCAEKAPEGYTVSPKKDFTDIFIYPGYSFKIVDSMITNLHLPNSTPLMMVCALAGKDNIFRAYEEAVKLKYRFFSYGDAMLII